MKKLFFLLLAAGLLLNLGMQGQTTDWVKTDEGLYNCKSLNVQGKTTRVVLENGEKKTLPTSTVLSYFTDDKLFAKMPLLYGDMVFMEFVRSREDMTLYKYLDINNTRYYVYKGGVFYMELLDDNKKAFEDFFFVKL